MLAEPIQWTCPRCGLSLRVRQLPVYCACGNVSGKRRSSTSGHAAEREAICRACEHSYNRGTRCKILGLGCRGELDATRHDLHGRCPRHKWPEMRRRRRVPQPVTLTRTSDLIEATYELAAKLPPDVTAIAGIPRSGMVVAAQLACHLHLPLYTVRDGTLVPCGTGTRSHTLNGDQRHVLVADDTTHNGGTLERVKASLIMPDRVSYAVAFCRPGMESLVGYYARTLSRPHVLEWNVVNTFWSQHLGLDMDGVVCQDCTVAEDDDGPRYDAFLRDVAPKHLPRFKPVRAIITARLEKYREQTEDWLHRHGCKWQHLVMCPATTLIERRRMDVWRWKAREADRLECDLFLESSCAGAARMDELCDICTPIWMP